MFENVPREKIPGVETLLNKTFQTLANDEKNGINMSRMKTVVERRIQEQMSATENSPHDSVASNIIADALYGNQGSDVS